MQQKDETDKKGTVIWDRQRKQTDTVKWTDETYR